MVSSCIVEYISLGVELDKMKNLSLTKKILLIIAAGFFFDLGVAVWLYFPKDYVAPQYASAVTPTLVNVSIHNGVECDTSTIPNKKDRTICYKIK